MFSFARDEDTICAVSTAPGTGGIAVLRVSGSAAVECVRRLCPFLPAAPESHRVYYGWLHELGEPRDIDEVLVSYFAQGRSFTGETTLEISCHGGMQITRQILQELVAAGCRLAQKGEFTYRAFVNGRIDLVQAESILALIESQSQRASRLAVNQLRGELSIHYAKIEEDLLGILAHLEANIDFAAEDIQIASAEDLQRRLNAVLGQIEELQKSYRSGRALKEGVSLALLGETNAGKSSLLNAILREDRAIVTPLPGTTRDWLEGQLQQDGFNFRFIDTAGLRETSDAVERLGIERSYTAAGGADYVLYVHDLTTEFKGFPDALGNIDESRLYFIGNKLDLVEGIKANGNEANTLQLMRTRSLLGELDFPTDHSFFVSAVTGEGLSAFLEEIRRGAQGQYVENAATVIQSRHFELLGTMATAVKAGIQGIKDDASPEFVAFELQTAIRGIHELLGKEFNDQVMDRVFREFCLGK